MLLQYSLLLHNCNMIIGHRRHPTNPIIRRLISYFGIWKLQLRSVEKQIPEFLIRH